MNTALPATDGSSRMHALTGFHARPIAAAGSASDHRAGAAVALGAAFLGAGESRAARAGTRAASFAARRRPLDSVAVQQEADRVGHCAVGRRSRARRGTVTIAQPIVSRTRACAPVGPQREGRECVLHSPRFRIAPHQGPMRARCTQACRSGAAPRVRRAQQRGPRPSWRRVPMCATTCGRASTEPPAMAALAISDVDKATCAGAGGPARRVFGA